MLKQTINNLIKLLTQTRSILLFLIITVSAVVFFWSADWFAVKSQDDSTPEPSHKSQTLKAAVPGEILVRFKQSSDVAKSTPRFGGRAHIELADAARQIPMEVQRLDSAPELVSGLRLARVAPEDVQRSIALLRSRSDVVYAEPNYRRFKSLAPNDPSYTDQWGLKNTGQFSGTPGVDIDAEQAWNSTTGSRNVVVGVVDEGIDINHPDLQANIWHNPGEIAANGIDDDANGFIDDINGYDFFHNDASVYDGPGNNPDGSMIDHHGTHVAGIVGAVGNNGVGVAGVNWEVSLMSLKFLGPDGGSVADAIRATNYAKTMLDLWNTSGGAKGANVHVLNNSYGGGGFSQAEMDSIKAANGAGILFVVSAGNESTDNDIIPSFPANYDVPNVISVASTTRQDNLSGFSNKGLLSVHLGAPGSEVMSTVPGNLYGFLSGTSMAAPHVSGTAALILALHPNFSSSRLRASLLYSTEPVTALENITVTGGRLNAANALLNANETDNTPPAVISDLHTTLQEDRMVTLQWTAPGDDGNTGQASLYEIRFADQTASSPLLLAFKRPAAAGSTESLTINIPFRHPDGSFVIKTIDNVGNTSESSLPVSVSSAIGDPYTVTAEAASALSTAGQHLFMQNDDSFMSQSLPFSFPYFDHFYSFVTLSTNGTLYLGNGPGFDSISRSQALNRRLLVAAAWDDLDLRTCFRADSDVYRVAPDADRLIFRWQGVIFEDITCAQTPPPTPKAVNFEVELNRNGTIKMRYGDNTPLHPIVGIGGGEPEGYVIATHTSEDDTLNLTNANTLVYTLKSLPKTADLAATSTVSPSISTQGQQTTFTVNVTNLGPSRATGVVLTDTIPNGSNLISCNSTVGSCQSIASNKVQVNLGALNVNASATVTVVIQPTFSSSTPFLNAATVTGQLSDTNLNNNDTSIATNLVFANINPQTGLIGLGSGALDSFVIRNDGIGLAFGWGLFGQIGDGGASDKRIAVRINGLSSVTQIEGGVSHSIARRSDGTVWTWGRNEKGQLGIGSTTDMRLPTKVNGITNAIKVVGGGHYSLALLADGTVRAWGDNSQGQLGDGTKIDRTTPVQVNGLSGVISIAAGSNHSLAVKNDGTVWSWGGNDHGQLGEAPSTGRTVPMQVAGLSGFTSVAAGDEFGVFNGSTFDYVSYSCALKNDGTVWTWGSNWRGQLGNGNMTDRPSPGVVPNLNGVTAISAGGFHVIALRNDGTVWGWGGNFGGQLGDGTTTDRTSPVKVLWLTGITAITAGSQHSMALRQDGHVFAWGDNGFGQTGSGQSGFIQNYPWEITQQVPDPPPIGTLAPPTFSPDGGSFAGPQNVIISHPFDTLAVTSLVTGGTHVVARLSNNEAWGWGSNLLYQLGIDPGSPPDPAKITIKSPVKVTAFDGFSRIAADNTHNVGLKADGTVWTWGGNSRGELGYSTTNSQANLQPAQVPGLSGIIDVAAGSSLGSLDQSRTMVLKNDGTVWYWGFGELNGDNVQSRVTPTQVTALSGIVRIATGNASFAIKNDGTVWAWGSNVSGQLGDGTHFNTRSTPAPVNGITNVTSIVAGGGHTVALKPDGTVWVWGNNDSGQLGLGVQNGDQLTPVQVPSLSGITAIAAGANFTFALKSDGTVWACGNNGAGALGDGTFSNHNAPTKIPGLSNITAIAAGMEFGIARRSDGQIFTWGRNESGQIGDGTVDTQPLATQMSQLNGGVIIHYTTNGTDPTENDPQINSGESVPVNQNLTLKARAFKINWAPSSTKSGTYVVTTPPVIQLSQTNISASEGTASLVVNVTRSGDLSVTSTVDYATSDTAGANTCEVINGAASSRCDYLKTLGRLSFASGENSKNISIPITDDAYHEGPETFAFTFTNPIAATFNGPATATLTINDNDATDGAANPIDTPDFFVRQQYLDFLNREPDPTGFAFWVGNITSCGGDASCIEVKRINVSAAFFLSIEFQETGYLVYRFYKSAYNDLPGKPVPVRLNEFLTDTQQIGQGVQVGIGNWQEKLEANKQAYALQFVQRSEFLTAYPNTFSADQFVAKLNTNTGGALSPAEQTNLVAMLGSSADDVNKRAAVLRAVAEDDTLRAAETNKAFVLMQYFGYMRRNPDDAPDANFDGWNFWLNKLNSFGGDFVNAEMVKAFISSREYRQRFGREN